MKVVGFHFVGPNAGEITQGFSLALKVKTKTVIRLLLHTCMYVRSRT